MGDVSKTQHERRNSPRFAPSQLSVQLRRRGHLGRLSCEVLDFNRFGLAVCFERPLPKEQIVYLSLESAELYLESVVGVVHNCLAHERGYRCGIRFRTQSGLQFDREQVEAALIHLESRISDRGDLEEEAVA